MPATKSTASKSLTSSPRKAPSSPTKPPCSSPCSSCPKPGDCCRSFFLDPLTELPIEKALFYLKQLDLPFRIIAKAPRGLIFACNMVSKEGRCHIYPIRPQLCRDFEPASDYLCSRHPEHKAIMRQIRSRKYRLPKPLQPK